MFTIFISNIDLKLNQIENQLKIYLIIEMRLSLEMQDKKEVQHMVFDIEKLINLGVFFVARVKFSGLEEEIV